MDSTYLINSMWVICAAVFVFMKQAGYDSCED